MRCSALPTDIMKAVLMVFIAVEGVKRQELLALNTDFHAPTPQNRHAAKLSEAQISRYMAKTVSTLRVLALKNCRGVMFIRRYLLIYRSDRTT